MKRLFFAALMFAPDAENQQGGGAGIAEDQKDESRTNAGNQIPAPNSNADGKIMAQDTLSNRQGNQSRASLKNPPRKDFWDVTVVDVSRLIESNRTQRTFRMVSFQPTNGTPMKVLPVNEKFFDANKDKFAKDCLVHITVDNTEEGITEYVDQEGVVRTHTTSGQAVSNVVEFSKIEKDDYIDARTATELEKYESKPLVLNALATIKAARAAAQK